jgi:DNA-binding SARP family transcriptional activator
MAMGEPQTALACADEAIYLLESSSAGIELVSARLARVAALAHIGDIAAARSEIEIAVATAHPGQRVEVATEAAETEEFYGLPTKALDHLGEIASRVAKDPDNGERALLARAVARAQLGDFAAASADLAAITVAHPHSTPAFELRRQLAHCLVLVLDRRDDAIPSVRRAGDLAVAQGARLWGDYASLLEGTAQGTGAPSTAIEAIGTRNPVVLSMAAEAVVARLGDYTPDARSTIRDEATHRPWRWLAAVRHACREVSPNRLSAAQLLEEIGEPEDVSLLRGIARGGKDGRAAALGRRLARRLATRVLIDDLGRVRILIGDRAVEGSAIRRKVLALLCLLLTRARWTATREDVVDSLWPDLGPQAALNSLNQTVYFLRRLFEPEYKEDTSPGYVQQDGETIWLDPDLIDARSRRCLEMIRKVSGDPDAELPLALAKEYEGKFALDFAYEEWASAFRDSLHAAYLRVVESAVRLDVDSGNYSRSVLLAERAYEVEPDSEELQLALVRIYRLAGAHAAAAEQYTHYAKTMRELGIEPRPLTELQQVEIGRHAY